ncbi:MAG TPA: hypothetical protein VLD65_13815 [Anaerolineales bacterium]|nr:hypothetical protein [Anaerolineales bacterium]
MSLPKHSTWIVRLYEWFHEHFPTYIDCRPIDATSLIQAAGFVIENHVIQSMWGLPVVLMVTRKA